MFAESSSLAWFYEETFRWGRFSISASSTPTASAKVSAAKSDGRRPQISRGTANGPMASSNLNLFKSPAIAARWRIVFPSSSTRNFP